MTIKETTDMIFKEIFKKGIDNYVFALRKDDTEYKEEETPRNSSHWYDFDWDNAQEMNGTCATNIDLFYYGSYTDEEIKESSDEIKEIIEEAVIINKDYIGTHWYVLYGSDYEDGQDENEIVLKDAKVLKTLE